MEKYITFSAPIKRKCYDGKTITYKLRFIDTFRFMSTSLSELVDNMPGNFNSIECKSCTENNRCQECKKLIERLIKKFPSIYQFCNGDLNKFILLLWKSIYPYEDMDNWEEFDEATLPPKEALYSNLNLENISDEDYAHAQKVWEVLKIWQAIHRYAKANDKYIKNYDKNNESSYLKYLDANNLYGWAMSQKLRINEFKCVKYVDVEYPKTLFNNRKDLPFLPEKKKVEKVEKFICGTEDKKNMLFT